MINFDSIQHSITIIAAVEGSLGVSDRSGILRWQKVAKKFPYLTILLQSRVPKRRARRKMKTRPNLPMLRVFTS